MLTGNLYIFFGEMSIQNLYPFLNLVLYLLLRCRDSLYILESKLLLNIQFSHSFPLLCCVKFSVSVLMVILDVLCIVSFLSLVLEIGRHLSYKLY